MCEHPERSGGRREQQRAAGTGCRERLADRVAQVAEWTVDGGAAAGELRGELPGRGAGQQHDRFHLLQSRAQHTELELLVVAAGDQGHGCRECRQGGRGGVRHGGRRVVDDVDAAPLGDALEAVFEAAEVGQRGDRRRQLAHAHQGGHAECRRREVEPVVLAAQPCVRQRQRADRILFRIAQPQPAAVDLRPRVPGRQRVGRQLAGRQVPHPRGRRPFDPAPGAGAEQRPVGRALAGEDAQFVRGVGAHRRIAVLVVGQDVGQQRDPRAQQRRIGQVAELPGGELQHHRRGGREAVRERERRHGDVAAEAGAGMPAAQRVVEGGRRGRLALAAGHGEHRRIGVQAAKQGDVVLHRRAGLPGGFQEARAGRNARVLDHQVGRGEIAFLVAAEHQPHRTGKPVQRRPERRFVAQVGNGDACAVPDQELRRGQAAAVQAEPHHRGAHPVQVARRGYRGALFTRSPHRA